jgi:hypothetical protein
LNGSFVYTPKAGFRGTDSFSYVAHDGLQDSNTATVTLTVEPPLTLSVGISGTAQDGQTLTATAVANDADATISFQWQQLIGGTWTDIPAANAASYLVGETDEGHRLRVRATASDTDGSGISVNSAATAAVTDPAPILIITRSSLFVAAGGSVALPISVTGGDADDTVSVTVAGLPSFETITDALDNRRFSGASVTLTAAEVGSGLTLHSSYGGQGRPVDVLGVTATDTAAGERVTSPAQTITVTDPPPISTTLGSVQDRNDVIGDFNSGALSGSPDFGVGADSIGKSVELLANYMASAFTPLGYQGPGNVFADRAGSLLGEVPSLVQPRGAQPGA